MQYRILGRTGLKVSEIGFGAWAIGGGMWGGADEKVSLDALRRALDLGVTFIDTAAVYGGGLSEQLVGRVVRERGGKVAVATKVPPKNMQWPARHGVSIRDAFPRAWVRAQTENSLRHLKVDCVDLQQLHVWAPNWVSENEWYEELVKLRQEGKVRFIGVSLNDHEPDEAVELVRSGMADAVQVIYNLFDQSPQDNLFPVCLKREVGVIARVPLDEGALTGKFTAETRFPKGDFRQGYFPPEELPEVVRRVDALKPLFRDAAPSLADGALKFCLAQPAVSTVIPGIRTPQQADLNCAASGGQPLSPALLDRLKAHRWVRR